jgi:ABC-type transport system substrate-binding protein
MTKFHILSSALLAITIIMVSGILSATAQPSMVQNPSVIPGSAADLHGPRVSTVRYPIFTSDHASLEALIAGQGQIMDYPPSAFSDVQTALSTPNLNVTVAVGSGEEFILFNEFSPSLPGYYLPFRQAMAHLVDYGYVQSTVLNGIQGVASPNVMLPQAYGNFSTNDITTYPYSLQAANQSLATDPQIAWNPTATQPTTSASIACNGGTGVWQYATALGSNVPNGTNFEPVFYTRIDHPTWLTETEAMWKDASKIGLCIKMIPLNHFSSVFPIVYKAYSNNWDMYFDGVSSPAPLDPILTLWEEFSKSPGWSSPFLNPTHFYNSTLESILHDMFSTLTPARAQADSQQAVQIASQQLPILNMWWDAIIIPSLNNANGQYWTGYVNVPSFSTWTFTTGYYTILNAHQFDPATGKTITGGTLTVNMHEAPDDFNVMNAESVYDFDIISPYYDSPMNTNPANPSLTTLIPWMVTSMPNVTTGVTTTTPHGYNIVNGMTITYNFYNNITFSDNVRVTADDFNFSLWYQNLNGATLSNGVCSPPCWMKYVGNQPLTFGLIPDLTDSQVTSPTTVTVYLNGTGFEDYKSVGLVSVLPEHLWSSVNATALNGDIDPTTNSVNGIKLITGTGPVYFGTYVPSQYITSPRFPGYFRTDIDDWTLPAASPGSPIPLSLAFTQQGQPIPSSAQATATLLQAGQSVGSTTLTVNGTNWVGSLSTTGLQPGFYELVGNATYTDSSGLAHEALQFWGVNLTSAVQTTTTAVVGPVAQNTALIAGVVIVVIIVVAAVAYFARRKRKQTK